MRTSAPLRLSMACRCAALRSGAMRSSRNRQVSARKPARTSPSVIPDVAVDPWSGLVTIVARGSDSRIYRWQSKDSDRVPSHAGEGWSDPELVDAERVMTGGPATLDWIAPWYGEVPFLIRRLGLKPEQLKPARDASKRRNTGPSCSTRSRICRPGHRRSCCA